MEIKQPFFSVIVPTTGGRLENLELVLTSLANQIFPKQLYEVIVVNDGGEGKEATELMERFARQFYHLSYVYTGKFEPLDFDKPLEANTEVDCSAWRWYDGALVASRIDFEERIENVQPRNKGTFFADSDFFIFADSDIILSPTALSCYFQDMMHNPDRIMLGVYHWLYPMHVTPEDVTTRFDAVINEHIAKKMLSEVEPDGIQTHNIMRDLRMKDFNTYTPDEVFTYPGSLNAGMAMFSGNICWPKYIFEGLGGYSPYLAAGAHEDGFSGISAYRAGYGISYDNRIIGGHLYHHRNVEWVNWLKWQRCEEGELRGYINKQFADFDEMTDIIEATEEEHRRLGVADWKEGGPEW